MKYRFNPLNLWPIDAEHHDQYVRQPFVATQIEATRPQEPLST